MVFRVYIAIRLLLHEQDQNQDYSKNAPSWRTFLLIDIQKETNFSIYRKIIHGKVIWISLVLQKNCVTVWLRDLSRKKRFSLL